MASSDYSQGSSQGGYGGYGGPSSQSYSQPGYGGYGPGSESDSSPGPYGQGYGSSYSSGGCGSQPSSQSYSSGGVSSCSSPSPQGGAYSQQSSYSAYSQPQSPPRSASKVFKIKRCRVSISDGSPGVASWRLSRRRVGVALRAFLDLALTLRTTPAALSHQATGSSREEAGTEERAVATAAAAAAAVVEDSTTPLSTAGVFTVSRPVTPRLLLTATASRVSTDTGQVSVTVPLRFSSTAAASQSAPWFSTQGADQGGGHFKCRLNREILPVHCSVRSLKESHNRKATARTGEPRCSLRSLTGNDIMTDFHNSQSRSGANESEPTQPGS
ncbi:hypothetical protein PDJAM_G00041510 [Pangasius djambal]|uniref:Uncharacterized protein n=1 Tax=Pangasius djambal TaxID=1691987 RepID=A0ACC5YT34_9TELE|nr:hypothetical protein [Pangasius djambal]